MRIAFFVGIFPSVSETFILRQVTALLDLGHAVDVFSERRPEESEPVHADVTGYQLLERTTYVNESLPPDAGYWEMPVYPLTGRTWLPGAARGIPNAWRLARALPTFVRCVAAAPKTALQVVAPGEYGYQARSLSALYRMGLLARRRGYDVLHAHFGPVGNTFRFARRLWNAPLVVSFHGYDFAVFPRQHPPGVYRRLFDTADVVTVNSRYSWARVEAQGCPPSKLALLHVGLDPRKFPFAERHWVPGDTLRLLSVARLVDIKGLEYAIRAVVRVQGRRPTLRYDIVGDGPLRAPLESLVGELGLAGIVVFHGARDGAYVRDLMQLAHLFLMPSVTVDGAQEGQGLVLQEAQACGLPVIATRHGALPEGMLADRTGLLVPERDAPALAHAIERLIEASPRWPYMGRCGREFVEAHYDIRRLTRELCALYDRIARAASRPRGHGRRRRPKPVLAGTGQDLR